MFKYSKTVRLWGRLILEALKSCKTLYIALVLSYIVQALVSYATILFFERFIESFSQQLQSAKIWEAFLTWGACLLIGLFIDGLNVYIINTFVKTSSQHYEKAFATKVALFPPLYFENQSARIFTDKAKDGAARCSTIVVLMTSVMAYYIPYFVIISFYLAHICGWFSAFLLLMLIPFVIAGVIRKEETKNNMDRSALLRRKYNYFYLQNTSLEYLAETRMYSSQEFFHQKYLDSLSAYAELRTRIEKSLRHKEIILRLSSTIVLCFFLISLAIKTSNDNITVGSFAVTLSVLIRLYAILEDLLRYDGQALLDSVGALSVYYEYIDMPVEFGKNNLDGSMPIVFDNVSFSYPNSNGDIITNLNLTIEPFTTTVIVGGNGAGKTTFANLLAGVYTPSNGKIYNIRNGNSKMRATKASLLCQKYMRYKMSLYDNVVISDLEHDNQDPNGCRYTVMRLVKKNGLSSVIDSNASGLDVELSAEFGGIDLSGGEWQRVALSRANFTKASLLILDEPNSSLDPEQEIQMYDTFKKIAKTHTTIIISHRLGITKIADRIILLQNGVIVEDGTFEQLMEKRGVFFEMYKRQATGYRNQTEGM